MNPIFFTAIRIVFPVLTMLLFLSPEVRAKEIDCLKCHRDIASQKVKHAAVEMGCPSCHSAVDAAKIPHKMKNSSKKGLASEQPDLCYGCHDKAAFAGKTVHAAVDMGCTGCHDPHASDRQKLLVADAPDLCFTCHDKSEFSKKNIHQPVLAGLCLTCHAPHSTDAAALLRKEPYQVCLDCHGEVENKPHAVSGFNSAGHPVGKKAKKDPKREGKKFYCGSCHNPHSSDSIKLFRYPATSSIKLCTHCHQY